MRILSRSIFREIFTSTFLGAVLFTFVLFLRKIEQLSAMLVRSSAPALVIAKLLIYAIPATIPFSLPLGVLVGILIGLSRMSADGEITAMRAAGIPAATVARPVLLFAFLGLTLTAMTSLWLTPLSLRLEADIARTLGAATLTADIEPGVFEEQFPNYVLYVADVATTTQAVWHKVFMADTTSAEDLAKQGKERGDGPRIIVAGEAIATPDVDHNRIQLDMKDVHTSERDKEGKVILTEAPDQIQTLEAQKPEDLLVNRTVPEMDTGPLYRRSYKQAGLTRQDHIEARIELHQRFALPFACLLLALVGIPLGVSSRKGGKSTAFVVTVLLAFLYYMGFISLIGLARKGSLPVPIAVWTPDALFAIVGTTWMLRLEKPGDRDIVGWIRARFAAILKRIRAAQPQIGGGISLDALRRFGLRPMLIDGYVLNSFLFYFVMLLTSLVLLTEVFTFFELLGDMMKNNISMGKMLDYLFHLAPQLIYDSTPITALVAPLICFGILTKHNEVTAFKAGGISVHRLAVPVVFAATVASLLLFAFDHYYIPEANRRQEALRSEIKNKPKQTYLRPDRQWVYGSGSRIYNYRYLDPHEGVMLKVNVYELDPANYHVTHQISAERARWEPALKTWVFEKGMSHQKVNGNDIYQQFQAGSATFPELTEPPGWFIKEEKEYKEMNFQELAHYIRELKASGLDTTRLQVQYHKKFAVPLFVLIMAILSIPFAFVAGNRGAMTGIGISFGIGIAYFVLGKLFEQVGDLSQLPPVMAAWAPDAIFALAGLYFAARMKT